MAHVGRTLIPPTPSLHFPRWTAMRACPGDTWATYLFQQLAELPALGVPGTQVLLRSDHRADAPPVGVLRGAVHLPSLLGADLSLRGATGAHRTQTPLQDEEKVALESLKQSIFLIIRVLLPLIEFVGMPLVDQSGQVLGVRFHNTPSVHCMVRSPPQVKSSPSPRIPLYLCVLFFNIEKKASEQFARTAQLHSVTPASSALRSSSPVCL